MIVVVFVVEGVEFDYFVNNVGFGVFGDVIECDCDEQVGIVDVNVWVLMDFLLCFVGQLIKNKGGLLNVGLVVGFFFGFGMVVYYVFKVYVIFFMEVLWVEFVFYGVCVIVFCLGLVLIEFQVCVGVGFQYDMFFFNVLVVEVVCDVYCGLMVNKRVVFFGFGIKIVLFVLWFFLCGFILVVMSWFQCCRQQVVSFGGMVWVLF